MKRGVGEMRGLKGKVAIVAGAAPGNIGAATAVRLAEEGATVVVADLNDVRRAGRRRRDPSVRAVSAALPDRSISATRRRTRTSSTSPSRNSAGSTACSTSPPTSPPATLARDGDVHLGPARRVAAHHRRHAHRLHVRHPPRPAHHDRAGRRRDRQHDRRASVWMGEDRRVAYQSAKSRPVRAHPPHRHARRQAWRAMQLGRTWGDTHRSGADNHHRGVS